MSDSLDFDLLIEHAPAVTPDAGATETMYVVRVISSPAGETSPQAFACPFSPVELENIRLRMGRPRSGVRRIDTSELDVVRTYGGRLFDAVVRDDVRDALSTSLGRASNLGATLRIRLRLRDCPELAEVPWELLYNRSLNRFLCLSEFTPVVRYLDLAEAIVPLRVDGPLRMLVIVSSPEGLATLDVETEWSRLSDGLGRLIDDGRLTIDRLDQATLSALQHRLRTGTYHLLHFIGHGSFDPRTNDGMLAFEDETKAYRLVSAQELGVLLHDHRSLRLVVLNACEGAASDGHDPYSGTAQRLIQQGIPAVVAMQFEISDVAALTFSQELYAALGDGATIESAVSSARKAIFARSNVSEWATPALYSRASDGRLFDVHPAGPSTVRRSTTEREASEATEDHPPTTTTGPTTPTTTTGPTTPTTTTGPTTPTATTEKIEPTQQTSTTDRGSTTSSPEPIEPRGTGRRPPTRVLVGAAIVAVLGLLIGFIVSRGDGTDRAASNTTIPSQSGAASTLPATTLTASTLTATTLTPPNTGTTPTSAIVAASSSVITPTVAGTVERQISFGGTTQVLDTGIDVVQGQSIDIAWLGGTLFVDEVHDVSPAGNVDAAGNVDPAFLIYNIDGLEKCANSALFAQIDRGPFQCLASESARHFTADRSGRLLLGVNDQGVNNNSGAWRLTVVVGARS